MNSKFEPITTCQSSSNNSRIDKSLLHLVRNLLPKILNNFQNLDFHLLKTLNQIDYIKSVILVTAIHLEKKTIERF